MLYNGHRSKTTKLQLENTIKFLSLWIARYFGDFTKKQTGEILKLVHQFDEKFRNGIKLDMIKVKSFPTKY